MPDEPIDKAHFIALVEQYISMRKQYIRSLQELNATLRDRLEIQEQLIKECRLTVSWLDVIQTKADADELTDGEMGRVWNYIMSIIRSSTDEE